MTHKHGTSAVETKRIKWSFYLNLAFTIIEIIGGILTNSMAILSDAAHDLGDTFSLGISWYTQHIAKKEGDERFTYGYRRYSVLGALVNIVILLLGSIYILSETITRLLNPESVDTKGMFYLAILGIIVNGAAVFILKGGKSINEKVVSLHLFTDVLGWVAILFGTIAMSIWELPIIDPILSLMIAGYILLSLYKNGKTAINVILQRTPEDVDLTSIRKLIESNPLIIRAEDLHAWSLDGEFNIMSFNIVIHSDLKASEIDCLIRNLKLQLKDHHIEHATIETKVLMSENYL